MFANRRNRLCLLMIALIFAVGLVFALNRALAQEPDQGPDLAEIDMRLTALEKTVDNLFTFIILIPGLAGLMVVVLEIRTWLKERTEGQLAREREKREAESATIVDKVMSSVNQILTFQAEQAKKGTELFQTFDPSKGIRAILDDARELRGQVRRYNLREHCIRTTRLAEKMQNLEDLYVKLDDLENSIDCNYIRGLAGLLNSQIETTDRYLRAVQALIAKQGPLDNIEAVSLYFLGIHRKNLGLFEESLECLERALNVWSRNEREIQTRIEIAEVVALKTGYTDGQKRTKAAQDMLDEMSRDHQAGRQALTIAQERNLHALKERLYLIEGNYAFKHKDWDRAIEHYEQARSLGADGIFPVLSIGLTLWQKGLSDQAKSELDKAYHLIVDSHREMTHPEPRGRILLGGSAVVAARLSETGDPGGLTGHVLREIEDLRWKNPPTGYMFHIFSPLTKQMHTLTDFVGHIDHPLDLLQDKEDRIGKAAQ